MTKIDINAFYLKPSEVVLDVDLPRFRSDMGNLDDLIISIEEHGQIQPILIDSENRLIAGGRRLACCLALGKEVLCIRSDSVDELEKRILELEENLCRKDFTIEERTSAVAEIHRLKQEKYGNTSYSNKADGWTLEDTARLLGSSRETVRRDIQVSELLKAFPELGSCKTKDAILKGAKRIAKRLAAGAVDDLSTSDRVILYNEDIRDAILKIEDASVDLILTDPPYGVNFFEEKETAKRLDGADFKFNDSPIENLDSWIEFCRQSIRVTKPDAHLYMFVGQEYYPFFKSLLMEYGWVVQIVPMVWHKATRTKEGEISSGGASYNPDLWPTNAYESILFARKKDSILRIRGRSNVLEYPRISVEKRLHPHEKPISLLTDLIERVVEPNSVILDPFMGSGSTLEAAYKLGMRCIGIELDKNMHNLAALRLQKLTQKEEEDNG